MAKHQKFNKTTPKPQPKVEVKEKKPRKAIPLSPYLLLFALVWFWAGFWYADVFRIAREYSFWAPDSTLMSYENDRPWGMLWNIGLMLLQLYRWPALGGLVTAFMLTGITYLTGYCLRLRGWFKLIQYVPAAVYMGIIAFIGFDLFFEAEIGMFMGIPFLALVVLVVLAIFIRSFSKKGMPAILLLDKADSVRQSCANQGIVVLIVLATMGITHFMRPYVRVVTKMQCQMMEQDWLGMTETARDNCELSYRQIAAYYAIALVQRGEIGSKLFDIRLDYDEPYLHGFDGKGNNASNYYMMDCDLYAGLVQTSIHHAMEQMTMNGPSIRTLKVLTKCALLNGEWEVARKYFRILKEVPFEGDWIAKYEPMVGNKEKVDEDPEFKTIRLTEPIHDSYENTYVQPVFLGYNAQLMEGRSINALWNSLAVHIYTKTMPDFIMRCQPMQGTTPPKSFSEALTLMSGKHPGLDKQFTGLEYNTDRLASFLNDTRELIQGRANITEAEKKQLVKLGITPSGTDSLLSSENRALHARELFPKYRGYYPYYYFFGNLKATKKKKENEGTSNSGVN